MSQSRPGILAVRAVNQYRRRDVLAYLSLRYYLNNSAARNDAWGQEVATDVLLTRTNLPYFISNHFKEPGPGGEIKHRQLFVPGANEAIAEAALLDACSQCPHVFGNPDNVYSYELNSGKDRSGIFKHYIIGLKRRHNQIALACEREPNGIVQYLDIQKFYPSIEIQNAIQVWQQMSALAGLSVKYREIGLRLLSDQGKVLNSNNGKVLTGPMFTHVIANLVLRDIDIKVAPALPAKYFRYVDDITLVGGENDVRVSIKILRSHLKEIGFVLHDESSPKHLTVNSSDWLKGRHDYCSEKHAVSWMTLIGDMKRYLVYKPEECQRLRDSFRGEGIRIPVADYAAAAFEASFIERVVMFAKAPWFWWKNRILSVDYLVGQAKELNVRYEKQFKNVLEQTISLTGFERKRRVPKLRYWASRLIYLADDDKLARLALLTKEIQELHFHTQVMGAVATGNIDKVLEVGANAAQAVAQPLRAAKKNAMATIKEMTPVMEQALAIILLNGVPVVGNTGESIASSELIRFATSGSDLALMKSEDPFIREIACLHGLSEKPRHPEYLESVFDEDDYIAFDAIEQLQESASL